MLQDLRSSDEDGQDGQDDDNDDHNDNDHNDDEAGGGRREEVQTVAFVATPQFNVSAEAPEARPPAVVS